MIIYYCHIYQPGDWVCCVNPDYICAADKATCDD